MSLVWAHWEELMKKMAVRDIMKKMTVRDILILGVLAALFVIVVRMIPGDSSFLGIMIVLIIILIKLGALERKIDNLGKQDTSSCDCSGGATFNGSQQSENSNATT